MVVIKVKKIEYVYYRGQKCKDLDEVVPVFGFGHYIPIEEGKDDFSKKLNGFYKHGYSFDYFFRRLLKFYKKRVEGDVNFDLICVCPSHKKDVINEHMVHLAEAFSKEVGIQYKQILFRTKDTERQHELDTDEKRKDNVKDSLSISEDVKGKNVIILDNTCITGSTCQEIYRIMKGGEADLCLFISLGLGAKATKCDFDINPTYPGKIRRIVEEWHWPKVSLEDREAYKKGQKLDRDI